jgi:hypothetical protein
VCSKLDWENSIKFHILKKNQEKNENEDYVYEELNEEFTDTDKKNLNLNTNSNSNLALNFSSDLDSALNFARVESSLDDDIEKEIKISTNSNSSSDNEDEDLFVICSEKSKNDIINNLKKDSSKLVIPNLFIEDDLFNSGQAMNSKFDFPNVYNVLQCLTLKSANDNFDLERYEILGVPKDIFLYFITLNTNLNFFFF